MLFAAVDDQTAKGVWKRVWKTRLSYVVAMSTVLAVVPVQRVG